ncbi:N-acetyl-gamma-glutamyl-phosphate reductase [Alicyclobacillus dauci]|uniref:N-acetyl-gamma-glutamyl-phosphate reductase n=1 Tax=Alicyclobacillus dauci TaxID=1475485 RepID=A0ABY6YYB0_9BACL|nr:N-acetyl-gamma-glutamyl-phosphate reductase [Alicyclobacillus dauci]WAH35566.1 N-acetyl-gamma-glutamyl-phosphate reductase [Alicyclobacillus dauci]
MSDGTIRVGVIGATGYAGMELIRLLLGHPSMRLTYLAGSHARSAPFAELFPHMAHVAGTPVVAYHPEECQTACDLVFVALPSGQSGHIAADLWARGLRVIDLSGDLRLPSDLYRLWYDKEPVDEAAQRNAVYGLTEFAEEELKEASLVANPGCYATAVLLALKPLQDAPFVGMGGPIIADAKSGVTGAGRSPKTNLQFAELTDDFYAYRVGKHQHIPEVERALSDKFRLLLTTQMLPINRGIFASLYIPLGEVVSREEIYRRYVNCYENAAFVHVLSGEQVPHIKSVQGSNHCHIGLIVDERNRMLQVFSALDNLQKGAAGQALQNANVMCGVDQSAGLGAISTWI